MCRVLAEAERAPLDWGLIWSTVITGIVVVFLILIILIVFLIIFGRIFKAVNKAAEKREALKVEGIVVPQSFRLQHPGNAQQTETPSSGAAEEATDEWEEEDDSEIIAVITAAIAAYGEAEGKQYRIAGVKRQKNRRSGWSTAGIADNMRGFMD